MQHLYVAFKVFNIYDSLKFDSGCTDEVVIPNQINSKDVVTIGEKAFTSMNVLSYNGDNNEPSYMFTFTYNETIISSVILPSKLKTIEYGAFANNYLSKVEFTKDVQLVGNFAFINNELLTKANITKLGTNKISIYSNTFDFNVGIDDSNFIIITE